MLNALCRPGVYSPRVRREALDIICDQIKRKETGFLIEAFGRWNTSEGTLILREIMYVVDTSLLFLSFKFS
jgi:hypothetical protein